MTRRLGKRGKVWYNEQKAAENVGSIGSVRRESICRQNAKNFDKFPIRVYCTHWKAVAGKTRKISENISGKAVKNPNPDTAFERKDVPP